MDRFTKCSKIVEKTIKIFNNSLTVIKGAVLLKQILITKDAIQVHV